MLPPKTALIVNEGHPSGWKIGRSESDGPYILYHDRYEPLTHIVSFDEACRLRDAMHKGAFVSFIRGYERFLEVFNKRIA